MVHVLKAKAIFDCNGDEESELSFLEGDIITDGKLGNEQSSDQEKEQIVPLS